MRKRKKPPDISLTSKIEQAKDLNSIPEPVIITYKIPFVKPQHLRDYNDGAKKIAEYAVRNKHRHKSLSSAEVKQYGLPSAVSNQILRKYSNKTIRKATNINLIVPGQSLKYEDKTIKIRCLKISQKWNPGRKIIKINQIEITDKEMCVCVSIDPPKPIKINKSVLGVDLNATHHVVVASDIKTGKVYKFGKSGPALRKKYQKKRAEAMSEGNLKLQKELSGREFRILKDLDHKLSNAIVDLAETKDCVIALEDMTNIRNMSRKNVRRTGKTTRRIVNSWSFARLRSMIEYKAKLRGVECYAVDPAYTSQQCSRCVHIGNRKGKTFHCSHCGHKDHADANAGFNIGYRLITSLEGGMENLQESDCRAGLDSLLSIDQPERQPAFLS